MRYEGASGESSGPFRVATIETIATDAAERTAREIEALRELPPPGTNGED